MKHQQALAKNKTRARDWFERAARQGYPFAQYNLYLLLSDNSKTGEDDAAAALKWLHAAADRELVPAMFRLAELYRKGGLNTARDIDRAAALYETAAIHGFAPAQYNIGRFYEDGRGVEKNQSTAFSWFLKAARRGVVDAQIKVGTGYQTGRGVAEDDAKGFRWFQRAALRNSGAAQYNLSALYALGKGVEKDLVRAYAWSELAARGGVPAALKNRDAFPKLLTPEQRARAKALTKQWSEQIAPGTSHDHTENSYYENGSANPLSGLEAFEP